MSKKSVGANLSHASELVAITGLTKDEISHVTVYGSGLVTIHLRRPESLLNVARQFNVSRTKVKHREYDDFHSVSFDARSADWSVHIQKADLAAFVLKFAPQGFIEQKAKELSDKRRPIAKSSELLLTLEEQR